MQLLCSQFFYFVLITTWPSNVSRSRETEKDIELEFKEVPCALFSMSWCSGLTSLHASIATRPLYYLNFVVGVKSHCPSFSLQLGSRVSDKNRHSQYNRSARRTMPATKGAICERRCRRPAPRCHSSMNELGTAQSTVKKVQIEQTTYFAMIQFVNRDLSRHVKYNEPFVSTATAKLVSSSSVKRIAFRFVRREWLLVGRSWGHLVPRSPRLPFSGRMPALFQPSALGRS